MRVISQRFNRLHRVYHVVAIPLIVWVGLVSYISRVRSGWAWVRDYTVTVRVRVRLTVGNICSIWMDAYCMFTLT